MEIEMIFAILGIKATKDKALIQKAYRAKLVDNNPEYNQEGFMRLSQAYEQALIYADQTEDEIKESDNSLVGIWMQQVDKLYKNIKTRIDVECWKKLLSQDICIDLEYGEEVKHRLFSYLMDNYLLPAEIFRFLDNKFGIVEGREELNEFLPIPFVDYMIDKIGLEDNYDFYFEKLDGPETANYDFFINNINRMEEVLNNGIEQAKELLDALKATGIKHPYLDAFEVSILARMGEIDEIIPFAIQTRDNNPDSERTRILCNEALYISGAKEEAISGFEKSIEAGNDSYQAEKYIALYHYEQGDFLEALKHVKTAMRMNATDEMQEISNKIDNDYLENMDTLIKKNEVPDEHISAVIRSLLRVKREKDALEYITKYPEVLDKIPYGESYKIDIYTCAEMYMDAILLGEKYIEKLLENREATEEWNGAFQRTVFSTGKAYQQHGGNLKRVKSRKFIEHLLDHMEEKGYENNPFGAETDSFYWPTIYTTNDKDEYLTRREEYLNNFSKARDCFEKFSEIFPDEINAQIEIIITELMAQNYKRVLEACDIFLEKYPNYYPVMTYKQQACYETNHAQEVVDLYHECLNIYPGYFRIYEFAAKIFIDFNQYDNAMEVIETAKKNGVSDPILDILEYRIQIVNAANESELKEYTEKITINPLELMKKLLSENPYDNSEKLSELFFVMGLNADYYNSYLEKQELKIDSQSEIKFIIYSIEASVNPNQRFYTAGFVYKKYNQIDTAALMYRLFLTTYPDDLNGMYNLANCLVDGYDNKNLKEGLEYYEQIIAIDSEFRDVSGRAAFYYKKYYDEVGVIKYLHRAVELSCIMANSENAEAYDYLYYGKYLFEDGEYEKALELAKKVIDDSNYRVDAHKLYGQCLRGMGLYQEAVIYFRKALDLLDLNEGDRGIYGELMQTYRRFYNFEQVKMLYQEAVENDCYYYNVAYNYVNALEDERLYEEIKTLLLEDNNKAFSERYIIRRTIEMDIFIAIRDGQTLSQIFENCKELYKEHPYVKGEDTLIEPLAEKLAKYYAYVDVHYDRAMGYMDKYLECSKSDNYRIGYFHYWTNQKYTYADENPYSGEAAKIIFALRLAKMASDKTKFEKYRKMFINHIMTEYGGNSETEAIENFGNNRNWCLNHISDILEYYILIEDKDNAKKWYDIMMDSKMCGQCNQKGSICIERYYYEAIYYEFMGEREKALEYYQKAFEYAPTIGLPYYKIKELQ